MYMSKSRHQTEGQNHYRLERYSTNPLKIRRSTNIRDELTQQNCIYQKIKSRLNSENVYYHAVENILSSRLLSENVKIKIHKTTVSPAVSLGCGKDLLL
jgi:hypothetical protein